MLILNWLQEEYLHLNDEYMCGLWKQRFICNFFHCIYVLKFPCWACCGLIPILLSYLHSIWTLVFYPLLPTLILAWTSYSALLSDDYYKMKIVNSYRNGAMKISLVTLVDLVWRLSVRFQLWRIGHVRYNFEVWRVCKNVNPIMIAKSIIAWFVT